jgi:sigma-B regulation protein RsbU (phosphoserine phosphatase)
MELNVDILRNSNEFLNGLLDSINSAIFIVDKEARVKDFNNSFVKLFKKDDKVIKDGLCGNIIGCYYAVNENADCGETSYCNRCDLRNSIKKIINDDINEDKNILKRKFKIGDDYIIKFLEYTVKKIDTDEEKFMMIILDDITDRHLNKIKLENRNKTIESLNKNLLSDLDMAKKVQSQLLPSDLPIKEEVKWVNYYRPYDKLGGDFFDVRHIDDKNISLTLFDVSGHGSPAALVTTLIKGMLDSVKDYHMDPSQVAKYINNQLCSLDIEKYVTLFYGVLDTEKKTLDYVNCGHPKPLLIENSIKELGDKTNMLLGFVKDFEFVSESHKFEDNDKMFVFSDGLIESDMNFSEFYKDASSLSISECDNRLKDIVKANYGKSIKDDICYIGFEII